MLRAAVAAVILAAGLAGSGPAATAAVTCPDKAVTCFKGEVLVQYDPAQLDKDKSFMITDGGNAPQAWQGIGGFAEGANPFCVMDKTVIRFVACIGGSWANGQGRPVVILYDTRTRRQARLDFAQLFWLDAWLARRGVR